MDAVLDVNPCQNAKDEALLIYNEEMKAALESERVLECEQLRRVHANSHSSAVLAYTKQADSQDERFQENLKNLNVDIHKAYETFIKSNDSKSEEIAKDFMEMCFSMLNKDVENKVFAHPGGHKEFLRRRFEATQKYKMQGGLGPMKEVILDQCLTKCDLLECDIISSDQKMTEAEKLKTLKQTELTTKQDRTEQKEKEYRNNVEDVKQMFRQHKDSMIIWRKRQEDSWLVKERELEHKMKILKEELEQAERKSKEAEEIRKEIHERAKRLEAEKEKFEELKRVDEQRFDRVNKRMEETSKEGLGTVLWKNKWDIFGAVQKAVNWWYS